MTVPAATRRHALDADPRAHIAASQGNGSGAPQGQSRGYVAAQGQSRGYTAAQGQSREYTAAQSQSRGFGAAAGASARGLLFTVLGEFVLPHGGAAWTSTLIDVLGRLGVEEKAARQALMRSGTDGWLAGERVGRRTRWRLTERAVALLVNGTERIYSFPGIGPDWDGRWVVALARVPESERGVRHQMRTRLRWAGFGSPAPGVWLSPHASRAAEAAGLLTGVTDAQVFVAERFGDSSPAALVAAAWDLPAIEAAYEEFLDAFTDPAADDPLTRLTELVHAWRRFPWTDPALPAVLLPDGWAGPAAATRFADRHAAWSPAATTAWLDLEAGQTVPS